MVIKKQQLLYTIGGVVRVYRTFCPDLFYVVSPIGVHGSFSSPYECFSFAYDLYCERFGDT